MCNWVLVLLIMAGLWVGLMLWIDFEEEMHDVREVRTRNKDDVQA